MKAERIYDGNCVADWPVPYEAVCLPSSQAERDKWGWKQDERGRWYREIPPGQDPDVPPPKPQ